ncbi:hypothetical protein PoB_001660500 [Plakobranchus ocellatus]|uniref:Uncharacterized protein n=1 Tax=Plakobranchus ocellatus TaxID=259542 RepID=A0AAV3Z6C2_9GAST|nr:hypothetical protein PoB_001660500 [Plakobranchus ocellatus]
MYIASPQQGDLRFSGPLTGQGASIGARTHDRGIHADLRADSPCTGHRSPRKVKEFWYSAMTTRGVSDINVVWLHFCECTKFKDVVTPEEKRRMMRTLSDLIM